jgi:hypothetical protein
MNVMTGHWKAYAEFLSVNTLFVDMLASMQSLADKKEIVLNASFDSDLGYILVDEGKI